MHFTAGALGLLLPRGNKLKSTLLNEITTHLGKGLVMLLLALVSGLPGRFQNLVATFVNPNTWLRLQ